MSKNNPSLKPMIIGKYRDKNWDKEIIPYIGENFVSHYKCNNKPYNKIRNVLVVDLGLTKEYNTVDAQVEQNGRLKKFIDLLDGELEVGDIVYHCFLNRKIENTLDGFSTDELTLYKKIKKDGLKVSAEILEYVIGKTRPDIIFIFGPRLNWLINYSFNHEFNVLCQGIHSQKYIVNDSDFEDNENIKRFFCDEKKHRYNAGFSEILQQVLHQTEDLKKFIKDRKKRYVTQKILCPAEINFDDSIVNRSAETLPESDMFPSPEEADVKLYRMIIKKDLLISSLNDILKKISALCKLKDDLTDADKNYYKPLSADFPACKKDNRVRAGRRERKKI